VRRDTGGDPAALQRLADQLMEAVATGTLHPELVAFYMRTLGADRATTEAQLRAVAAGLREFRDARRAVEGGRDG
jgi:hypothetical protein